MVFELWKLGMAEQIEFFHRSFAISYDWWFDRLDCSVSFVRQKVVGVSFDCALGFFREGSLSTCIFRRGFGRECDYYEVGFREMSVGSADHFLYILVAVDRLDDLCVIYKELGGVLD